VGGKAQLRSETCEHTKSSLITGVTAALFIREGIQVEEVI
jgi:hypothetical protein